MLGSGTLAREGFIAPTGSLWLGCVDGEPVMVAPADPAADVRLTHTPFGKAFYDRKAPYFVLPQWIIVLYNTSWQAFCACYHNSPTIFALLLCASMLPHNHKEFKDPFYFFGLSLLFVLPVNFMMSVMAIVVDVAAKWVLLGRRKPGSYPWDESSYCQRWQIYLTLQEIRRGEVCVGVINGCVVMSCVYVIDHASYYCVAWQYIVLRCA